MDNGQRTPRVSPDWDPADLELTPSEAFLLSRIDGYTPWQHLRQIAGIPPEDVDRCLERWLAAGLLTVNGSSRPAASAGNAPDSDTSGIDASGIDGLETGIDLTPQEQRRILEFEASLDRPYHALLGVDRDADAKAIKRAYFALSREFHPDRHFRREIGGFKQRLEHIFMNIVEAYELLSDPATRAEIERCQAEAPPPPEPQAGSEAQAAASNSAPAPPAPPQSGKRAALEGLRRHFRIPEKVMVERRFKARQFYQAAMVSSKKGRWLESAASVRLAIAFDPWNDEYKRTFAQVQAQVHQVRAAELLRAADASLDARTQHEAMRRYEEALSYRPCDPEINEKAALLALELGDLDAACEYAGTAAEVSPQRASPHRTFAKVLVRQGVLDRARAELNRALEIDPDDEDTKSAIEALKRKKVGNRKREGIR